VFSVKGNDSKRVVADRIDSIHRSADPLIRHPLCVFLNKKKVFAHPLDDPLHVHVHIHLYRDSVVVSLLRVFIEPRRAQGYLRVSRQRDAVIISIWGALSLLKDASLYPSLVNKQSFSLFHSLPLSISISISFSRVESAASPDRLPVVRGKRQC